MNNPLLFTSMFAALVMQCIDNIECIILNDSGTMRNPLYIPHVEIGNPNLTRLHSDGNRSNFGYFEEWC